jgi:hypothetical protein
MVLDLIRRMGLAGIATVLVICAVWGLTASNTVPSTHAGQYSEAITPDQLKPAACAGITLTNLVTGSGTITGTNRSNLILGSSGDDTLGSNGVGQGPDCCVGGGGTDTFRTSCTVRVP